MPQGLALFAALALATPQRSTFLFELHGTPVGTVELALDGGHYSYRSRHLFTRGADRAQLERTERDELGPEGLTDAGARPESLWLWRQPLPGCSPLREELTGRTGMGCVTQVEGDLTRGTVFGEAFEARYRERVLEELTLGPARFVSAGQRAHVDIPPDLFGAGVAIAGKTGPLALVPAVPLPEVALAPGDASSAQALAARVHASFPDKSPSAADWDPADAAQTGGCVGHARRYQKWAKRQGRQAAVVFGLLSDDGRAYPHAWIRVAVPGGTLDLDPTTLEPVGPKTHLPLSACLGEPPPALGRVYLDLGTGASAVIRRPVQAR